ncbi:TPA: hypothetical protein N0F65_001924 [Lagenidium giganteum]|uniref:Uncharacterized protein n=1 Tax=Lagenidium giganteum TaxID=4803 RepID=A0AAV2Z2U4_9STRA|nr:TPA: hypothetical protein N0F65_001924 [Lagenidium giganteum]
MPKLRFVCRHLWPSPQRIALLQKFISTFVWNARFDTTERTRSWLNAAQASLDIQQGGLAIPSVSQELIAMAAATTHRQLHRPPATRTPLTVQIPTDRISQPARIEKKPRCMATLYATGMLAISRLHACPRRADEVVAIRRAMDELHREPIANLCWRQAEFHVQATQSLSALQEVKHLSDSIHGLCNLDWISKCAVDYGAFLLNTNGTAMKNRISLLWAPRLSWKIC